MSIESLEKELRETTKQKESSEIERRILEKRMDVLQMENEAKEGNVSFF